jgi:hypothetical protein
MQSLMSQGMVKLALERILPSISSNLRKLIRRGIHSLLTLYSLLYYGFPSRVAPYFKLRKINV